MTPRYTSTDPAGVPAQPAWECSDCARTERHPVVIDRQAHDAWHDEGGDDAAHRKTDSAARGDSST